MIIRTIMLGGVTCVVMGANIANGQIAHGNAEEGIRAFRVCASCHSLEPGRELTGPSLAKLWGRKAGTEGGFRRYSPALKSSGVVWGSDTLDRWLANPSTFIPGNRMPFAGIKDDKIRRDLIAYLEQATSQGKAAESQSGAPNGGGGMSGMMGGGRPMRNLKRLAADEKVTAITYCKDTYKITTADGMIDEVWEFNIRFKTDSSNSGPNRDEPAYIPASMMGDRGFVIFSDPSEISSFIGKKC